jgi:hypothetical protein
MVSISTLKRAAAAALLAATLAVRSAATPGSTPTVVATANLQGSSGATGSGQFEVTGKGVITGTVRTKGIRGETAQIYMGARSVVTLSRGGVTWVVPKHSELTREERQAFLKGGLYVTVRGGAKEIRGKILPEHHSPSQFFMSG